MVFDSRREEEGYDIVLDYRMSEKFGLNWRENSYKRMAEFIEIMGFDNERQERESKKQEQKYGRHPTASRRGFGG